MAFFHFDRYTHFSETDAAGIIHFSKIACYVEEVEHAFYVKAGYPIEIHNTKAFRWPRVSFKATYTKPIFPFQMIRVTIQPKYVGSSSINWSWSIADRSTNELFCTGEMKSVCCAMKDNHMEACPLPDDLRRKLIIA